MTPTLCWVFLLALVGRAASVPRPLVVDACALLCNPGAETESERERDPEVFPRYPKVNCKLQSDSDEHQAWIIASHCLKLCNQDLSIPSEVNCFALRSSLEANLGCYCEALTPLSPNTMRLHETWRLNFLVKELADDILNVILSSPLDTLILCEIHQELFNKIPIKKGKLFDKCIGSDGETITTPGREKREVEQPVDFTTMEQIEEEEESPDLPPTSPKVLPDDDDETIDETTVTEDPEKTDEIPPPVSSVDEQIEKEKTTDLPPSESIPAVRSDEIVDKPTVTEEPINRNKRLPRTPPETKNPDVDEDSKREKEAFEQLKKACEKTCRAGTSTKYCICEDLNL